MLYTLKNICLCLVSRLIFHVWNFNRSKLNTQQIIDLKRQTRDYFHFPHHIAKSITDYMFLKWGYFAIGHAIWLLETGSPMLNLWFWHNNIDMQDLCLLSSTEAQLNLQEIIIPRSVKNIQSISSFKNLRSLNLTNNTIHTSKEIKSLLSQCHNLVKLNLEGCTQIGNKLFKSVIKMKFMQKNLRSLHICNTSITSLMANRILHNLPLLESFTFHDIFGFLHLRHHRRSGIGMNVHNLSLGHFSCVYTSSVCKKFAPAIKDFNYLKQLELIIPQNCELKALKSICKNSAYLDALTLWFTSENNAETNTSTGQKKNFSDIVQSAFVDGENENQTFPLSQLKLICVQHIELNFLFCKMPNLNKLCLENCNICSEYERKMGKSLVTLYVNNLRVFDVREILLRCPYLEELEFAHIPMKSALFTGIKLPCLKKFSVYQCMGPPLDSVNVIMTYFPKLLQ